MNNSVKEEDIGFLFKEKQSAFSPNIVPINEGSWVPRYIMPGDLKEWPDTEKLLKILNKDPLQLYTTLGKLVNPETGHKGYLYIYSKKYYKNKDLYDLQGNVIDYGLKIVR